MIERVVGALLLVPLAIGVGLATCAPGRPPAATAAQPVAATRPPPEPPFPACECPACPAPRPCPPPPVCKTPTAPRSLSGAGIRVVEEGCPAGLICLDGAGQLELIRRLGACEGR